MTAYTSTTSNQPSPFDMALPEDILKRLKTTQEVLMANAILGEHSPYFIPIPDFIPMPFPKERNPYLFPHSMMYGPIITDPRKFACIVDASMVPDSRPTPLRWTLRFQGYRAYAKVKRQRRERAI